MAFRKDIKGNKYGHLTAIMYSGTGTRNEGSLWLFRCDCGNERTLSLKAVTAGRIRTCGKCELKHKLRAQSTDKSIRQNRITNALYQRYIRKATTERRQWQITYEKFSEKIDSQCAICSSPPSTAIRGSRRLYNPIQLVDLNAHYTDDNTLPICKTCGELTGKFGISEAIDRIITFHKHLIDKSSN